MADLLAKNTIFFHQISDGVLLMLVHPTSQGDQQKSKGIQTRLHRRIIAPSTMSVPICNFKHFEFSDHTTLENLKPTLLKENMYEQS